MKLLIVVPHPDDEVYGAAGTILDFVAEGRTVGLITLTRGEKGRTLGLAADPEELAALRAGPGGELQSCLEVLGVQLHRQYTYPDGGLKNVDAEELTQLVHAALEELRPEIVLTFPPNGANGHPDHVATSRVVREAFARAGQPCTLWYYAGTPPEDPALLETYLPPTVERDVTHHIATKLRAISMHRSQALSTVDFLRRYAERITHETFHQAYPPLD
ncbi:LmbE family N-acetylglucosaminyl deacetylase [Deinobacterium chartae]|uniref:LmbE family N-acetylglucosaminyl deacetylase n=1 Tax=Deinobacterium chartae TaxID=521158 RepID=A0A841I3Q4_9DEIO|nr:PIG-L deacetylase family protein [Deinobacterium chartae]MBB6099943.1 LmbE family N-acetylglucosaminyl deacetylase [Deinobacterium chartae]